MKTLDEVIERLEGIFGYISDSTKNDVLHYLKMYRSDQIQYAADRKYWQDQYAQAVENFSNATAKHLEALKEIKGKNDPLTWDELKTMEGKPVFLEQYWYPTEDEAGVTEDEAEIDKYWAVIDNVQAKRIHFVGKNLNMGLAKSELDPNKHGGWQAYRKERE